MTEPSFHHLPVMLREAVDALNVTAGGVYLDGTLGGGGHSEAILTALSGTGALYGIDRDAEAIAAASARLARFPNFHAVRGNFHDARALLAERGVARLDGALLDLGVSSRQLDARERGFSYHADAPLDMRMDADAPLTAADIVAGASEAELARILRDYGEEKWAARIAKIIVERRADAPLRTTGALVAAVDAAIPKAVRRRDEGHPARRTFQALRIAVNDELAPLETALRDIAALLAPDGRLAVITFHSLEDRIVKNTFRSLQFPCVCPPKAPICTCGLRSQGRVLLGGAQPPTAEEAAENPRARSAKLRAFARNDAPVNAAREQRSR